MTWQSLRDRYGTCRGRSWSESATSLSLHLPLTAPDSFKGTYTATEVAQEVAARLTDVGVRPCQRLPRFPVVGSLADKPGDMSKGVSPDHSPTGRAAIRAAGRQIGLDLFIMSNSGHLGRG